MHVKCCLLAVVVACSSTKHERREPAPARGFDPTSVPVAPAQDPTSVPVAPAPRPVAHPAAGACAPRSQPKACPATQPNINHPCATKGLQCTYGASCCPPVYVCNSAGVFEARFVHCS
jgi:hypothetical protein